MTEIVAWEPSKAGSLELPVTYVSGDPDGTTYGLFKGKCRGEIDTEGDVREGEYQLKFPAGMSTGVSPGNTLYFNDDQVANTDGVHVDSWEEIYETIRFRLWGGGSDDTMWEVLASTGSVKMWGQHGFGVSNPNLANQLIVLMRALPRSDSPWGSGVLTHEYALQFAQQGAADQTGAPQGGGGTNATYSQNVGVFGTDGVTMKVNPHRTYTIQTYMKMNGIGLDNGILMATIDVPGPGTDRLVMEYRDCRFRDSGNPRGWFGRHHAPVLGGGGPGTKDEDSWMSIQSLHIKVRGQID